MRSVWWRASPLFLIALCGFLQVVFGAPSEALVTVTANMIQVVSTALGAAYLLVVANTFGPDEPVRKGWLRLAMAMGANSMGFVVYAALELAGYADPFPSIADLFWVITYPLALWGVIDLARRYNGSGLPMGRPRLFRGVGIGALVVVGAILLTPVMQDQETPAWQQAILLSYPVGDVLLISAATYMAELFSGFGRGALAWPWVALGAGYIAMGLTDIIYVSLDLYGLYHTGHPIDFGWVMSGVLMGIGGFLQWRLMTRGLDGEGGGHAA